MKWFEPLIALAAIGLVILPIILRIRAKKKGKSSCGCDCGSCSNKDACCANFKDYVKKELQK